jgi:putative hemolysin
MNTHEAGQTVTVHDVHAIAAPPKQQARLEAVWAAHADDVQAAQRLRHRVFAGEMGANMTPLPGTPAGLDADRYDAHCEHLLVRTVETADRASEVVGTYRVLPPDAALRTGGLYSETEFDLTPLDALRPRMAELGRSCTAEGWRNGGVILLLWSALAEFLERRQLDLVVGCASVPMHDGGHLAASLWSRLQQTHLATPDRRVQPRLPLPVAHLDGTLNVTTPPLIKGYLKCGAKVLGPPAWDPDFGVADLPLMMDLADLPRSYRSRFMG